MKHRQDAVKKAYGTIIEQPRSVVVAVGPDCKETKVGDEVTLHRKAVAFEGTAIDVPGFGIYVMCEEKYIIADLQRLPDDEAVALYEAHLARVAEGDHGARGEEQHSDEEDEEPLVKLS